VAGRAGLLATWAGARRRLNLVQLVPRSAELPHLKHLANRVRPFGSLRDQGLPRAEEELTSARLQAENGIILQQGAGHIAARLMQGYRTRLALSQPYHPCHLAGSRATTRTGRPDVDH
jgi:hypothetical protein